MLSNTEIIILVPIFVILLLVIFKPIKAVLNLGTFSSCVLTVCVSVLCIIGMIRSLKGSLEIILLPYTALAIAILLVILVTFIGGYSEKVKRHRDKEKGAYIARKLTKKKNETTTKNIRKQP